MKTSSLYLAQEKTMKEKKNYKELLREIKAIVLDVDGVLTDGKLLIMSDGSLLRNMQVKDGYAIQLAIKKGLDVAIITGGSDPNVEERLRKLGIKVIYLGAQNKLKCYEEYKLKSGLSDENILYMGDDLPDYGVLQLAGVSTAPIDATNSIKEIVDYVSPKRGGEGCVRDIIEQTMKVQDIWSDENI